MDEREQIERYAFGKLSGELLRDFEARLAADPDFAAMVRQETEMLRALRLSPEVDALRAQLVQIENGELKMEAAEDLSTAENTPHFANSDKRPARIVLLRWLLAAVAALVLLAAAVLFLKKEEEILTPEQIFARHFQPPPSLKSVRRIGETDDQADQDEWSKQRLEAENLYEKGDFKASLEKWKALDTLPKAVDYQGDIGFKAGLTALRAGDSQAAISFFEKIPASSFRTEKPWYLALARLRAGEIAAAKKGFEQVAASDSPFGAEARAILKNLSGQ